MKPWEPHLCLCGLKLINPKGAPHCGVVWAASYDQVEKAIFRREKPEHDIYIYKNNQITFIRGKCQSRGWPGLEYLFDDLS